MKKRKKWPFILAILVVLLGIGSWYLFFGGRITGISSEITAGEAGTRSLVVYFSRVGEIPDTVDAFVSATPNSNQAMEGSDTEAAAKMIQELTGADLYQIRTERYYRSAFWGTAATAWIEEALNLRPGLAAQPENLDDYDVIYVGYPIWWFNAPMAIGSFLESYDLSGKTIVPFCTSSDNGIDVSMDYIRDVSEGATVLDGYRVHNSDLDDVAGWLTRIGILDQADGANVTEDTQPESSQSPTKTQPEESSLGYVTEGTEEYRGFIIDNVFHSVNDGDIHYNVYIPESYDSSEPYALYFTLPGYGGLYFQGVAVNLKTEEFGFEAQKYNEKMIIVAPQLSDWGETSANQTIALVEYFLEAYNIDRSKVYGNGFSGGGETMSQVMGKRPDLFTAYLQVSSQWDGDYEPIVEQRLPVYFAIGRGDEYYGLEPTQEAYDTLHALYEQQGLSEAEIDELLVLDVKEHEYFTDRGMSNEHGGGGLFAYDEEIMGWLFSY
ncbi:MAG: prolyl oligopeptidase family serine peptidase [Lachnospiraceae bacterium]|nr:prolyl oligopeptidase family serine peptidase [Lachnospiraceae bacterium]MBP3469839.1 prolyl oligopeptidase family serine peptidase [Lachnospiraceae bacterium]